MQTNQQYPKKDNSFPFQFAFMVFIFNMKESFLEPQLGEVQTWRRLVLPFGGKGMACYASCGAVAGRTAVLVQGAGLPLHSVCMLHRLSST